MNSDIVISKLDASDKESIDKIASWYLDEWDCPIESTIERLSNQPNSDTLFQLNLTKGNVLAATGGLCNDVNIIKEHTKLEKYIPWVALLYTQKEFRNQGLGQMLLEGMERRATESGLKKIYLATFTAESLYSKCGWTGIEKVRYRDHDT
ncbi:MAG: GNAT superfamily N-acetyltransferase, partial [Flavobacteriales bacterium]